MTTLTGIKNAEYLAQFLGKKIAVRDAHNPKRYFLYPKLYAIYANNLVDVETSDGMLLKFSWNYLENPYIIIMPDIEVIIK